jgi:hypothetical protein
MPLRSFRPGRGQLGLQPKFVWAIFKNRHVHALKSLLFQALTERGQRHVAPNLDNSSRPLQFSIHLRRQLYRPLANLNRNRDRDHGVEEELCCAAMASAGTQSRRSFLQSPRRSQSSTLAGKISAKAALVCLNMTAARSKTSAAKRSAIDECDRAQRQSAITAKSAAMQSGWAETKMKLTPFISH